jgi:tetrapyrrole methylase family protein/MazG family protein
VSNRPHDALTIVGLGPGDASLLTVEALNAITTADEVWLRTARHPTVPGLPAGPEYHAFDDVYDGAASFDDVYQEIVARVLELARRPQGVLYAVPGHPLIGEATTVELLRRAGEKRLAVRLLPGVSFVDVALPALGLDALADGMLVLDALAFGEHRRLLAQQRPTLIAQVYNQRAASAAKLALLEAYPAGHPVRIIHAAGTTDAGVTDTTVAELDRAGGFDHLASLYVPPLALPDDVRSFEGVRAIVARLRTPEIGCPWDLEQTHETLKRFLLEEAYEALEALDAGEPKRLAEELGDLLMQILLHAQVAEDNGEFTIEDVMASIGAKLVRRHPHVFGDLEVDGAGEVLRNWDTLKKQERGDAPLLDAVPRAMPALAQAQSVQSRAASAGLDTDAPSTAAALAAWHEGVRAAVDALGDALFSIVREARARNVDAEEALRLAVQRYRTRIAGAEASTTEVTDSMQRRDRQRPDDPS